MLVGDAYVAVRPDVDPQAFAQEASGDIKKAGRRIGSDLGDEVAKASGEAGEKAGERLGTSMVRKLAAAGIGALIARELNRSIEAASDLAESVSKVDVVFGDASGAVQQFASDAATSLGQSRQQALEATGTFGNLLTSIGILPDKAAELSTSMVQLASDLASFNNASPEETLLALRSGLVGETEPLKRFGIALNQARIEQEAMSSGLIETKDQLDQATKAQAVYQLILQDSANAQGDFARTSEGLANQSRILEARLADVRAEVGAKLLPVKLKLVEAGSELLDLFLSLDDSTQNVVLALAALTAAGGTTLIAVGNISRGIGSLAETMTRFEGTGSKVAGFLRGPWGIALGVAAVAVGVFAKAKADARAKVEAFTQAIEADSGAIGENTRRLAANRLEQEGALQAATSLGLELATVTDAALGNASAQREVQEAIDRARQAAQGQIGAIDVNAAAQTRNADAVAGVNREITAQGGAAETLSRILGGVTRDLDSAAESQGRVERAADGASAAMDPLIVRFGKAAEGADELDRATREATEALRANRLEALALADPVFAVQKAAEDLADAEAELTKVLKDGESTERDKAAARRDVAQAGLALIATSNDLTTTLAEEGRSIDDVTSAVEDLLRQTGIAPDTIAEVGAAMRTAGDDAATLDAKISAATEDSITALLALENQAATSGRRIGAGITDGIIGGLDASKVSGEMIRLMGIAESSARDRLEMFSPSRVFVRIGEETVQGYLDGLALQRNEMRQTVEDIFSGVIDGARSALSGLGGILGRDAAQQSLADAEAELAELRRRQQQLPGLLDEARTRVDDEAAAGLTITPEERRRELDAIDAVTRARQELAKVEGDWTTSTLQRERASLDVTLAEQRLAQIQEEIVAPTRDHARAVDELNRLREEARGIVDAVQAAERDVEQARLRAIDQELQLIEIGRDANQLSAEQIALLPVLAERAGISADALDPLIERQQRLADATNAATAAIEAQLKAEFRRLGVDFGTTINTGDLAALERARAAERAGTVQIGDVYNTRVVGVIDSAIDEQRIAAVQRDNRRLRRPR